MHFFSFMMQCSETRDTVRMIKDRLEKPDCARKGWILEGFPKTRTEAFLLRKAGVFPTHIGKI